MVSSMKKELQVYFGLTLGITWLLWLPSVLSAQGYEMPVILLIISMMASFTPSIVGLVLHERYLGKDAFKSDMKSKLNTGFNKLWLLAVPIFFFATAALSYWLMTLLVADFIPTNTPPIIMTPLVFLQILFIGGALGEEFGWRGFAQPRLQTIMNPLSTTLVLGLIWSLWHLPLFFMIGTVQSNIPIWQFMLQNTAITFLYTWLYNKAKGNLWLMIYLHAVANTAAAVIPYWQNDLGRFIGLGILSVSIVVLYFVWPLKDNDVKNARAY